jgi:hypothetical protein
MDGIKTYSELREKYVATHRFGKTVYMHRYYFE